MDVVLHRLARVDYDNACRHLGRHAPQAELRYINSVREALARIAALPQVGSPIYEHYRFVKTKKFRYVIYYGQTSRDEITVYAVAHANCRPGYWLRRTRRQ